MESIMGQKGMVPENRDEDGGEGLGALVFLFLAAFISLAVLIGVTVLCRGPRVVAPF
jgi:hypothetical protein